MVSFQTTAVQEKTPQMENNDDEVTVVKTTLPKTQQQKNFEKTTMILGIILVILAAICFLLKKQLSKYLGLSGKTVNLIFVAYCCGFIGFIIYNVVKN